MEQYPLETNSYSVEIAFLLWNPKVHYCAHKSLLVVVIPNQMNPVHTFPPSFPKIQSNIIFPDTPRSFA